MNGDALMKKRRFSELLSNLRSASAPQQQAPEEELGVGALAYLGDSVYELWVRLGIVATETHATGSSLHRDTARRVCAESQAAVLRHLEASLTESEKDFVRRARNAKVGVVPRSASPAEYRLATALEALLGYLFWHGDLDRLVQILVLSEEGAASLEDDR